jgi:hypothetical protein
MIIAAVIMLVGATLSWIAVRRCPLARAVGIHIDQISSASR